MEQLFRRLHNTVFHIKQTQFGYCCVRILKDIGLWDAVRCSLFFKSIAKKKMRNPTAEMLESKKFYRDNLSRVLNVADLLSDELSKRQFLDIIDFRGSANIDKARYGDLRNQYFGTGIFTLADGEVYVDCGAEAGDTIKNFKRSMKRMGLTYKKIIAIEPNEKWWEKIENAHKDCTLLRCGVWSEDKTLAFTNETMLTVNNIPTSASAKRISVVAIDNCAECSDATFIKMDIEGAELPALIGAERLIKKNKPKLAICIYHSDEDMLRIAEWIHEKVPEYKLFIRHHCKYSASETVLYATI